MKELFVFAETGLNQENFSEKSETSGKSETEKSVSSNDPENEKIQEMLNVLHEKIQKRKKFAGKLPPNKELVSLLELLETALNEKQKNPSRETNQKIVTILNDINEKLSEEEALLEKQESEVTTSEEPSNYLEFGTTEEAVQGAQPKESEAIQIVHGSAEELFNASIEFLKKTQLDSGGCLATTQDERYPYIYPRDHAITTLAFVESRLFDEARKALDFAFKGQDKETGAFPQRWDQNGHDSSYKPVPVDSVALILYAFARYVQLSSDVDFAEKKWDKVDRTIDFLKSRLAPEKNLVVTTSSLNEFPPTDNGYDFWSNACVVAAMDELSKVAAMVKAKRDPVELSNTIKEGMLNFLWNSRINSFVKIIRLKEASSVIVYPDASLAAISFFEVFPVDSKRVKSTIERIESQLVHPELGGICRRPKFEGEEVGGYGPWPFHTLLLASHYIKTGEKNKALEYINWVVENSTNGKICEHVATKKDFEEFVSDYRDAGLLKKDLMVMIENTRQHEKFSQGIARITEPFAMSHAMFAIVYSEFKNKFK